MKQNPIIIVDDDEDDLELIRQAGEKLDIDRPMLFMRTGEELVEYLESDELSPFLILCDVNLPRESGFQLRERILILPKARYKSVPFVFWSTSSSEQQIQYAYDLPVQGYFFKPNGFEELCDILRLVLSYWLKSQHPKSVG